MTSSSTTARTRREAFSKGEGAPRDCSLGRFGLLAPHNARARGWRHRRGRPGGLENERSRERSPEPVTGSVVPPPGSPFPGLKTGGQGALSPGVPGQVHWGKRRLRGVPGESQATAWGRRRAGEREVRASPSPRALPVMVRLRLLVAHRPEPWGAEGRPQLAARSGCLPAAAAAIRGSLVPCLGLAARTWTAAAPVLP